MRASFAGILWLLSAAAFLFLIAQPISTDVQWLTAATAISIGVCIYVLRLQGPWRFVFLAVTSVVVLRYAYWRTTATLPSLDDPLSFVLGMTLYGAEMYCLLMLAMSLFVVADPIDRAPAPIYPDEDLPSVDVFVPSYDESSDILSLTLSAAKALDYPAEKLTVWLLDDGSTDQKRLSRDPKVAAAAIRRSEELQELCRALGVSYLTRAANLHAKAGNLNNGLANSRAELVVVFDADHAPAREFLQETVGHFKRDPKLFLVQTPHFFSNPDPLEKNLGTFRSMPSENEMFYHTIQKGLDKWNAAFFCGSAAVLRRAALERVGGFSGVSITEDCETALDLHSKGWNSLYVDKPMVTGLQPDTLASFIGQRSRWCRGMIQILLLKTPAFRSGLTFAQRICYMSSGMFWFFPIMRMIFLVSPLLFIVFDLKIFNASVDEFVSYTVTYLVVGELMRNYLYGRVRWPWVSDLYEYIQSVYLFRAILSVIINPRRPTFNVTAKGQTLDRDRLSELAWPYFLIFGVLAVAMGTAIYRFQTEPEIGGMLLVVGAWNLMNLIVAGAALGVVVERRERRQSPRLSTARCGILVVDGSQRFAVHVDDVSLSGARLLPKAAMPALGRAASLRLEVLDEDGLELRGAVPVSLVDVSGSDAETILGIRFDASPAEYGVIADLMLADMEPVRQQRARRRRSRGIVSGSLAFIRWSVAHPLNALRHLLFDRDHSQTRDIESAAASERAPSTGAVGA